MTWILVLQIIVLMVTGGVIVNTVGADLIKEWKGQKR